MSEQKSNKKIQFNTTINENISNEFKKTCRELGLNMSIVLELFMQQFCEGTIDIEIKLSDLRNMRNTKND